MATRTKRSRPQAQPSARAKLLADCRRQMAFANLMGVGASTRVDWHEPDEQDVSARVVGRHLDNAMGHSGEAGEMVVEVLVAGNVAARVNLATLLAVACAALDPDGR